MPVAVPPVSIAPNTAAAERKPSVLASCTAAGPAFIVPVFPCPQSPRSSAAGLNKGITGDGSDAAATMRRYESLADHLASSPDDVVSAIYCLYDEDVTKVIISALDGIAGADTDREVERRKSGAIAQLLDSLGDNRKALIFAAVEHYRDVLIRLLEEFVGKHALGDEADPSSTAAAVSTTSAATGAFGGGGIRFVKPRGHKDDPMSEQERWIRHYARRYKELMEESELNEALRKDFRTTGVTLPSDAKVTRFEDHVQFYLPPPVRRELPKEKRICVATEMPAWTHAAFGSITHLNTLQTEVFESAFRSTQNMLVCAPTGAGKTGCALLVILRQIQDQMRNDSVLDRDFKIVYVAPMKALASEMADNFSRRLQPYMLKVREFTGDMQLTRKELAETCMLVTTPEKWDVVTRKQADNELAHKTRLIILDEVHLLNDERGPVIEALVARTLRQREMMMMGEGDRASSGSGGGGGKGGGSGSLSAAIPAGTRIVGLSATLPNYKDVARFLHVDESTGGLKAFGPEYRPVPLEQTFIALPPCPQREKERRLDDLAYQQVIKNLKEGHQVMVFVHSRRGTSKLGEFFLDRAKNNGHLGLFNRAISMAEKDVKKKVSQLQGKGLADLCLGGIGVHHAGLLRFDRNIAEKFFADGFTKVLVCTATLAWGVNLPAHTVIIRGTEVHDPKKGGPSPISVLDVLQCFGRAGRPQFDTSGHGILIADNSHVQMYIRLIAHALPIESQMKARLVDHLNAEIHAGTVTSVPEGVKWLEYTYLWQRIRANPLQYGLSVMNVRRDPNLKAARYEIVSDAATALHQASMVRYNPDTGSLDTTDFGRIASHFYIEHTTMQTFQDKLRKKDGSGGMVDTLDFGEGLNLIACANEFAQLRIRQDELEDLQKINELLPKAMQRAIRMVQESADETSVEMKVVTLLKAYIGRVKVESHSLSSDINYIVQNAQRICRALFEIELQRGHPHTAGTFLTISKCIERRLFTSDHPLLQFGVDFTDSVLRHLNETRVSLQQLSDMTEREVGNVVHNVRLGATIHQLVRNFPLFEIETEVQPITRTVLRMKVTLKPNFEWNDKIHGGSVEVMWLFVEDSNNNFIFHHEQVLVKRKEVKAGTPIVVNIVVPIVPEYDRYSIRVVSDRWLGCEEDVDFSVAHLHLPDDAVPHTPLLPLAPISKHAIPERYHPAYPGFSQFNAVQSQCFHIMMHTDHNVLLGAPTGSGKTICAELAMLRVFERNRIAKMQWMEQKQRARQESESIAAAAAASDKSELARPPPREDHSNIKPFHPEKIVYIGPLKALVKERMKDWRSRFVDMLGLSVVELSGDVTPDISALASADVLCATPEKWDGLSRNWQVRSYIASVALVVFDEVHMLGSDRGPILEVIVSRMRYIGWHRGRPVRLVGLSTAVANPSDMAFWLGVTKRAALFNFHPSTRPVPMRVHISGYPGRHYCLAKTEMEILTSEGWKNYAEMRTLWDSGALRDGTVRIAGFNQQSNSLVFENVCVDGFTDNDGPADDGMYEILTTAKSSGKNELHLSLLVTGNHHILVRDCAHAKYSRRKATTVKVTVAQLLAGTWPGKLHSATLTQSSKVRLVSSVTHSALTDSPESLLGAQLMVDLVPALRSAGRGARVRPRAAQARNDDSDSASEEDEEDTVDEREKLLRAFCLLYGFWLGDGTIDGRFPCVQFSPRKNFDVKLIKECLTALGLNMAAKETDGADYTFADDRVMDIKGEPVSGQAHFRIYRPSWVSLFFSEYGWKYSTFHDTDSDKVAPRRIDTLLGAGAYNDIKTRAVAAAAAHTGIARANYATQAEFENGVYCECNTKSVKWFCNWVWKLGLQYARQVLTGIAMADGEFRDHSDGDAITAARGRDGHSIISTSCTKFRDDLMRLALHAGFTTYSKCKYNKVGANRSAPAGHQATATQDSWIVGYSTPTKTAAPVICPSHIKKLDEYKSGSWCVMVPSGNIIVRRRPNALLAFRPVIIGNCPRMATMNKPTYNAIVEKSPSKPVLVFVSSRRQTRLTAMALINFLLLEDNSAKFVRMSAEEVQRNLQLISDPHLKHCVQFGIGIHHAGLCEGDKALMEDLYRSGRLQILVATSTLAWGVNFPAHLVVVKGTEFYDAKTKTYVDQSLTDILQQIGRAGRPQYDTEGVAVVLCHEPKKSFFRKFLYDPFPVESALHKQLHAHINAEIVAGTIATRQDAVDYLTWTYLFRRLAKNPSYYGLGDASPKALTLYLSTLVRRVLGDLEMSGCIESPELPSGDNDDDDNDGGKYDPNVLRFTVLGKICSYYYLAHETAAFFNRGVEPTDDHGVLLKKLCDATEFAELPVRHNEDKLNMELARNVPMGIDLRVADSPHVKAFLLFQAHFERCKLPIVDYHTDQKSAIDNSIRTLQAMVDITANNGHLFAVLRIMNLMQCMVQARWWHSPTLLQLPHITEQHLPALGAAGITHIGHLVNGSLATLDKFRRALQLNPNCALQPEHVAELVDAAKRLPLIDVHAEVKRKVPSGVDEDDDDDDETYEVKVELTRLSEMTKFVVAPKFAKQKDEQYWLVLGHEPSGELVALKRINRLFRRTTANLVFDWDDELWNRNDKLTLFVICDSYIGLDQQYHLKMPF